MKIELKDAKQDLQHMLSNRRSKPSIFGDCIGHVWAAEFTPEKGPHFHTTFFFNGNKIANDAYMGTKLGDYWKEKITDGKGIYHNCNTDKKRYIKCGIGMINHTDSLKREYLNNNVIDYLVKTDQSIDDIREGKERSFGRGTTPKKTSNAGRPRLIK